MRFRKKCRIQKIASLVTIFNCLANNGFCSTTQNVLTQVQTGNTEGIRSQVDELKNSLINAAQPLAEGKIFLQALINDINNHYGMQLTILDACRLVRENFHRLDIPLEVREPLLMTIALFEAQNQPISSLEMSAQKDAVLGRGKDGYQLYWPWEWSFFGLNKDKHKSKRKNYEIPVHTSKAPALELPNHMAVGFSLALAGALVFILPIPGAQFIGAEMVAAGGVFFLEGLANGEKPYYVDSETGMRIDRN